MLLFGDSPNAEDQQLKMKDLKLIFSAYDSELTQRALTNEDALSILANYMQTQDFNNVKFIVSGFSRINGQEYQLLQAMMEKGNWLSIYCWIVLIQRIFQKYLRSFMRLESFISVFSKCKRTESPYISGPICTRADSSDRASTAANNGKRHLAKRKRQYTK